MSRKTSRRLRCFDLMLIIASAPLWVPILGFLGLAVVLSSGRPMFFHQSRVGRHGKFFEMRKFRSMTNGDNPLIPDPTRITPIGKVLRRTSLDELPQLLHVLRGSMSLVGPRPMLPSQKAELDKEQEQRLLVRPGLTGLAQVSGRNSLSWEERFVFDVEWAQKADVATYLSVLRRTASTVISGAGVSGHDRADRFVAAASNGEILMLDQFDLTSANSAKTQETASQ
jgi:lipopolysaccharide/colanic/teichoic acid biosynthesis glycosyltransferase